MLKIGSLLGAAIAIAMTGITAFAPALAQQAQTAGIVTFDLFADDESVELNPDEAKKLLDAVRKAQAPGECPLGRITIITPEGDRLFQEALGKSRRDAVLQFLDRQGIDVNRFLADAIMFDGNDPGNDTQLDYLGDDIAPTLDTDWAPISGTPVKPGDQIKVTMVARDDPNPRPSGIKTIQLVADSEGGHFIASENYEACSEPRERRVEATYTVPANPPPVVRLTALAVDHAGHMDTDLGKFPTSVDGEYRETGVGEDTDVGESRTGDWYGTFTMVSSTVLAPVKSSAQADIVLRLDGKGNLTGTMIGQREVMAATVGDCSWQPIQPGRFRVSLVGSYTEGRSLKVFVENVVDETRLKYELRCSGISIPLPELGFKPSVWGYQAFLGTPSPLGDGEVLPDGSRQYKLVTDMTTTWTVTLRPTP